MDFCRWNYGLHKISPKEITKLSVDENFVKFCCLLKENADITKKQKTGDPYGRIAGDSFHIDENDVWELKNGTREMEYCPADEAPDLSTDLFAMGLILYEMIKGKSFCNEKDVLPGLLFEYEDLCTERKGEGKTSLLDETSLPKEYQEFGYILKELTQLDPKERIRDFDEFPAAEYTIESVEAGTGRKLRDSKAVVLEELTQTVPVEKRISVDGVNYELIPGSKERLGYTFLKKKVRLMYRKV